MVSVIFHSYLKVSMKKALFLLLIIPTGNFAHFPGDCMPIEQDNEQPEAEMLKNEAATRKALTTTTRLLKRCFQSLIVIESQKKNFDKINFDFGYNHCLLILHDIEVTLKTQPHDFSISLMLENITTGYNSLTYMLAAFDRNFTPGDKYQRLPLLPFKDYQLQVPSVQEIASFNKILRSTEATLRTVILKLHVSSSMILLRKLPRIR